MVGGSACRSMAAKAMTASTADAALRRCPVMLLVPLTGIFAIAGPKARCRALVSNVSPARVLVAWALM